MDRIDLTGVRARGFHGVHPEERRDGQAFVADVTLHLGLEEAAGTDRLDTTVHYGHLAREVAAELAGEPADLIETVAGRIADRALARERVRSVTVTVHKPEAPIAVPFGDVAVTVERARAGRAVIALGANLGDRAATLARALEVLDRLPGVRVTDRSPVIETVAVTLDGPDSARPRYLNQVAALATRLDPKDLLATLHAVEHAFGRERDVVWGDRTLDLDLVAYDAAQITTPSLVLPHPRAHLREFVLRPWLAMEPEAVVPGHGRVADLLAALVAEGPGPVPAGASQAGTAPTPVVAGALGARS
jgi:dihydroneopterin aldolase/2-amino-4-hydroxy-6-hydroxymethyldihydropteridine diphosphokinase